MPMSSPSVFPRDQNACHDQRGNGEAQKQQRKRVDAGGAGVMAEDRQCAERGGGDDDVGDAECTVHGG
jgi:hypothetical protein